MQIDRSIWRGKSLEERNRHLLKTFIVHPLVFALIEAIEERIEKVEEGANPAGILILAPSGGGKTRFCEFLGTRYTPERLENRTKFRFIAIETPQPCTPLEVANAILSELGDPFCEGRITKVQCKRARLMLVAARTIILAVDNAHDIVERTGPKGVQKVGNYLRLLIDKCNLVVLLLGLPEAAFVVDANPQLKRRVPGRSLLSDYDITKPDGLAKFLRLQHELDDVLPLAKKSGLGKGQMGKGLAYASDGKFAHLVNLLTRAMAHAVKENREVIALSDLSRAYKDYFLELLTGVNPFKPGFKDWRRLNRPGEPHHVVEDPRVSETKRRVTVKK